MKFRLKRQLKKHEAVVITLGVILAIVYFSESQLDTTTCSVKNPDIDCSQRGYIDISQLQNNPVWTKTTGLGLHYINGLPVPEYRNGYQHAVCDLGNSTCEYHFDTYQALDAPFGTVLHVADALTLYVGGLDEFWWQALIWGGGIFLFYLMLKEFDRLARYIRRKM